MTALPLPQPATTLWVATSLPVAMMMDGQWHFHHNSYCLLLCSASAGNGRPMMRPSTGKQAAKQTPLISSFSAALTAATSLLCSRYPLRGKAPPSRKYQYTDKGIKTTLASGSRLYYRLRTVDINGGKTYSAIVVLTTATGDNIIYAVFPNPARDVITITCSTSPANAI